MLSNLIIPFAVCVVLVFLVVDRLVILDYGRFHKPFLVRLFRMGILVFFIIFASYLVNIATKLSLQIFPMEIKVPLLKL